MTDVRQVWRRVAEFTWREAGDPHPVIWMWWVNDVLGSFLIPSRLRVQMLRMAGLDIDRRAIVRAHVIFRSRNVHVGPGTVISWRCLFDTREGITIGARVGVGADTRFLTSDHDMSDPRRRSGLPGKSGPIRIGDGARIATASTVMPRTSIGAGAVVAAGSMARGNLEPHTLYAGTPAVARKPLPTSTTT